MRGRQGCRYYQGFRCLAHLRGICTLPPVPQEACSTKGASSPSLIVAPVLDFQTFKTLRLLCGLAQSISFCDLLPTVSLAYSPNRFLTQILREHLSLYYRKVIKRKTWGRRNMHVSLPTARAHWDQGISQSDVAKSASHFQGGHIWILLLSSEYSPSPPLFPRIVFESWFINHRRQPLILNSLPILLLSTDTIYPFYLPSFRPGGLLIASKCLIHPRRLKIIDAIRRELCIFQALCWLHHVNFSLEILQSSFS